MTESVQSVDNPSPENVANVASDISILNPKATPAKLSSGVVIYLHMLRFKDTAQTIDILGKYYPLFVAPTVNNFLTVVFGQISKEFFVDIKSFLAMSARKPLEEISVIVDELDLDDVYLLLETALKININFFAEQLRPIIKKPIEEETIGALSSPA